MFQVRRDPSRNLKKGAWVYTMPGKSETVLSVSGEDYDTIEKECSNFYVLSGGKGLSDGKRRYCCVVEPGSGDLNPVVCKGPADFIRTKEQGFAGISAEGHLLFWESPGGGGYWTAQVYEIDTKEKKLKNANKSESVKRTSSEEPDQQSTDQEPSETEVQETGSPLFEEPSYRKKWVAYILAIVLGWAGAHHAYLARLGTAGTDGTKTSKAAIRKSKNYDKYQNFRWVLSFLWAPLLMIGVIYGKRILLIVSIIALFGYWLFDLITLGKQVDATNAKIRQRFGE